MRRPKIVQRLRSLLLLTPLLAFMICFFLMPLLTMMTSAVSDPVAYVVEVLRLEPSLTLVHRRLASDCTLGSLDLRRGEEVAISLLALI